LIVLILAAALLASSPAAIASMQLVPVDEPTSVKTFHTLHGINESADRDVVSISQSGSQAVVTDEVGISGFPADCHALSPVTVSCTAADYDDIAFFTGPGNDRVNSTYVGPSLTIDQIVGPDVSVYINAALGPGNDRFNGDDGTDAVGGGPGRDRLIGKGANDLLDGQGGNDLISGGAGTDEMFGGSGRDRLIAGPGVPDYMIAGNGRDTCIAHERRDRVGSCERILLR
jgi:Ca2+-binding RTX toxin-like protein